MNFELSNLFKWLSEEMYCCEIHYFGGLTEMDICITGFGIDSETKKIFRYYDDKIHDVDDFLFEARKSHREWLDTGKTQDEQNASS